MRRGHAGGRRHVDSCSLYLLKDLILAALAPFVLQILRLVTPMTIQVISKTMPIVNALKALVCPALSCFALLSTWKICLSQEPSHRDPPLEEMLQQLQSFFGTLAGQSDRTLQDVADEEDLDVDEEVAGRAR